MNDIQKIKKPRKTKELTVIKSNKIKKINPTVNVNPEELIMAAVKNGASIDMLERLLNLQERIQKEKAMKAFREAMAKFQAECPVIPKRKKVINKDGKTIRYKYAPIEEIITIVSPHLANNDLSYNFKSALEIKEKKQGVTVTARAFHILGHSEESSFWVPVGTGEYMSEQQEFGSACTFAARYAFRDVFGIITGDEDNDANIITSENDEMKEKKEEEIKREKKTEEALAKLNALPENIKTGFEILKWNKVAQWKFAEMYSWDKIKMKAHINQIIDKQNMK